MNKIRALFSFCQNRMGLYALIKAKHYIFCKLYMLLYSYIPASYLKHFFTSGRVTIVRGLEAQSPLVIAKAKKMLPVGFNVETQVASSFICFYGENVDFSHEEVVIVAHWDMDNIVDPYVVHMCKAFINMGKKIVLASAHPLAPCHPLEECESWCHAIVCRTCDGYDFTSWKAAMECFPTIYKSKELTLTNDSNFGPIPSFSHVYARMQSIECDFWGLNYALDLTPHLQSFYLVFKPAVLQSSAFKEFFTAVPTSNSKEKAIALESALTLWLAIHGFRIGAFCKLKKFFEFPLYLQRHTPLVPLEFGAPVFKRLNLFGEFGYSQYLIYKKKFPNAYPWHLIDNYKQRKNFNIIKNKHF